MSIFNNTSINLIDENQFNYNLQNNKNDYMHNNKKELKVETNSSVFTLISIIDFDDPNIANYRESKEQVEFKIKKAAKQSVLDSVYSTITDVEDTSMYNFLLNAANSHKIDYYYGRDHADIKIILKGGGACRFYNRLFGKHVISPANRNAMDALYKDKVSDIDVDLYYKGVSYSDASISSIYILMDIALKHGNIIRDMIARKCNNIETAILNSIQYNENKGIVDPIKLYGNIPNNDAVQSVKVRVNNDHIKDRIINQTNHGTYYAETDQLLLNDNTGLVIAKRQLKGFYISYANDYRVCSVNDIEFGLARLCLLLDIEVKTATKTINNRFPVELYDIGINIKSSRSYSYDLFLDIGKYSILKFGNMDIYGIDYIVKDLYQMLFDGSLLTWKINKYEKRLKRFIYFATLLELDIHDTQYVKTEMVNIDNVFKNSIIDIDTSDLSPMAITIYRKKVFALQILSQRYHHQESYLYLLIDPLINILIISIYYNCVINNIQSSSILYKNEFDAVNKYLTDHWSLEKCKKQNSTIVPIDSRINPNITIHDYVDLIKGWNELKKYMAENIMICKNIVDLIT